MSAPSEYGELVRSLRREVADCEAIASRPQLRMAEGMGILGKKMAAAADAIEALVKRIGELREALIRMCEAADLMPDDVAELLKDKP